MNESPTTGDPRVDGSRLRLIRGGMANTPKSIATASTSSPPLAPPGAPEWERVELHRHSTEREAALHKINMEVLMARDRIAAADRARLTWIGAGLVVLFVIAVGVAFYADKEIGKEVLTHAGALIGGILGGMGIRKVAAPALTEKSE